MKLLVSAFLLLALGYLVTAEVVQSFATCSKFFLKNTPPTIPGGPYKMICQERVLGTYEFATLYDTNGRSPVYSAFRYQGKARCQRSTQWYIEPQLDDPKSGGPVMASEGKVNVTVRGNNQALNKDYNIPNYDKGHLLPVQQQNNQACANATFTLTNAAPQYSKFNRGQWKAAEKNLAKDLDNKCLNKLYRAYVVTGVKSGNTLMNNRVNIPSYFWTAYCCVDNNDKPQVFGAYYGKNDQTNKVTNTPIPTLNNMFGFKVFANNCP